MKGQANPLTKVLERANIIVEERLNRMIAEYGMPLTVVEGGKNEPLKWPEDPEKVTPEQMQVLVDTRGETAVNIWLSEHYANLAGQEPQ